MATSGKLTSKQRKVLQALVAGATARQAAAAAGYTNVQSVYNLCSANEAFRQALSDAESAIVSETTRLLSVAGVSAVTTLVDILDSQDSKASQKATVAKWLLELAPKWRDNHTLEERILALEQLMEGQANEQ